MESLTHAGSKLDCKVKIKFIDSDRFISEKPEELIEGCDGILVPGGFGVRGVEGKIQAARYAREKGIPFLGVCLGFQIATIEIARDVLGLTDADSAEFNEKTANPIIVLMPEQEDISDMGGTMRLGVRRTIILPGTKANELYGSTFCDERHRHRYEVNTEYIDRLESVGWRFSGRSEDGKRMEIAELQDHPYFLAAQFHPEFKSRPLSPSPLHLGLVQAAIKAKYSI